MGAIETSSKEISNIICAIDEIAFTEKPLPATLVSKPLALAKQAKGLLLWLRKSVNLRNARVCRKGIRGPYQFVR